ncbi:MAG TPA: ribosome biogenesis factor YjgA [Burkholderiales bacterium]|nr:ribosome biogenesis factor YjgA [Burkholderiales bacterium]
MQDDLPSKTKRKQAMHELQALGAALVALPQGQLAALGLPAELAEAVAEAQRITSREGRRRQLQYIGRVMRELDPAPIRAGLERIAGRSAEDSARHRRLEQWRARLLEDDAALTDFASTHPTADLQALRALIRNARREQDEGRPPRAFREIYRVLREVE